MMNKREFDALIDDMREEGFRRDQPVVLHEGAVLDGRNRIRAAALLGMLDVVPKIVFSSLDDATVVAGPLSFVVSRNLNRRHLTTSQRAMIAAKMATAPLGRRPKSLRHHLSVAEVAKMMNVGSHTISRARRLLKTGDKGFVDAVIQGRARLGCQGRAKSKMGDSVFVLLDGTPIEEVPWTGLASRIEATRRQLDILQAVLAEADAVAPFGAVVGEVYRSADLARVVSDAERAP